MTLSTHSWHCRQGKTVSVYKEQRFIDHAPLIVDYDHAL
jgi:hypothetical protein